MSGDEALERVDRLRVRGVAVKYEDISFAFLARFQATAASLKPDERIRLEVFHQSENNIRLLKAVLADPQAKKVCWVYWMYDGEEDVTSVIPLLLNSCPELASLQVHFNHHFAFDFVSSVLEHPSSTIKVFEMPQNAEGNQPRFFAALRQSQVSALTIFRFDSSAFYQGLYEYLARDLLVRLMVWQTSSALMVLLAKCTRLAELGVNCCEFLQPTAFAKSITKLVLCGCTFVGGFDWSFLMDSGVKELDLHSLRGVDGNQLGGALAVHLRAKGLDTLRFNCCDFVNETLVAAGVEIGRIKILHLGDSYTEDKYVDDASVELLALVLQSPNSELRELRLGCTDGTVSGIENHLVPALRHPNCTLAKLSIWAFEEHEAAATTLEDRFRSRRGLFALLQGQRVRKQYCTLRRLPVEMLRLVGEVLL